jgi:hypothetical protein
MAYEIIILVREECKNINAKQNQPKRSGSCVCIQELEFLFIESLVLF